MAKSWLLVTVFTFAVALSGCGGSDSPAIDIHPGGGSLSPQYTATLPDGSPMDIEVVDEGDGMVSGSFAVAAVTGPYAFQVGAFEGSISGGDVTMYCTTSDGATQFQMSGTQSSSGFELTRSDIAGTVLHFTFEAPDSQFETRGDVSTNFSTSQRGTSGKLTLSTTPYSVQGGGTLTEYRGTWLGVPATFWQYSTGQSNIVTYVDNITVDSTTFSSYKISDVPTASVTSGSGTLTAYSNTSRQQYRFNHVATCTP